MPNINVGSPSDTGIVSQYPTDERASRSALLTIFNGSAYWGGTAGGTDTALTVTVDVTGLVLQAGLRVLFIAGVTNIGTEPTLQVNALAVKAIRGRNGGANTVVAGELVVNFIYEVIYDGTAFRLLTTSSIEQATYDALFPVNFIQLKDNQTTPVVPAGIVATWTRISSNDYIRNTTGAPGTGGSATSGAGGDHTHGGVTGTSTINIGGGGEIESGNEYDADATGAHNHTIAASGTHTHSVAPNYRSFSVWERTA